jgi:hypothetical protein
MSAARVSGSGPGPKSAQRRARQHRDSLPTALPASCGARPRSHGDRRWAAADARGAQPGKHLAMRARLRGARAASMSANSSGRASPRSMARRRALPRHRSRGAPGKTARDARPASRCARGFDVRQFKWPQRFATIDGLASALPRHQVAGRCPARQLAMRARLRGARPASRCAPGFAVRARLRCPPIQVAAALRHDRWPGVGLSRGTRSTERCGTAMPSAAATPEATPRSCAIPSLAIRDAPIGLGDLHLVAGGTLVFDGPLPRLARARRRQLPLRPTRVAIDPGLPYHIVIRRDTL